MDRQSPQPMNERPADEKASSVLNRLKKEFVVVGRRSIRVWHVWLVTGLVVGSIAGVTLVANRSGEIEGGLASIDINGFQIGDSIKLLDERVVHIAPQNDSNLSAQLINAQGKIIDGPIITAGFGVQLHWYKIDFVQGPDGWIIALERVWGSTVDNFYISSIPPECGNNLKEENEQCDDGNNISGDGCSDICELETFGVKQVDPFEYYKGDPEIRLCFFTRIGGGICRGIAEISPNRLVSINSNNQSSVFIRNPEGGYSGFLKDGQLKSPLETSTIRCFSDDPSQCALSTDPIDKMPLIAELPILSKYAIANDPVFYTRATDGGVLVGVFNDSAKAVKIDPITCEPLQILGGVEQSIQLFLVKSFSFGGNIGTQENVFIVEKVGGVPTELGVENPWLGSRLERYYLVKGKGVVRVEGWEDLDCKDPDTRSISTCDGNYSYISGNTYNWILRPAFQFQEHCAPGATSIINSRSAYGRLDQINDNGAVIGWAIDKDTPLDELTIEYEIDGKSDSLWKTTTTIPRQGVNDLTGFLGTYGFRFTVPDEFVDNEPHTLRAFVLDTGGLPRKELARSPMTFTVDTIPPTINIVLPQEGQTVPTPNTTLAVGATDNISDLKDLNVTWSSDRGYSGNTILGFGFVGTLVLDLGTNIVTVKATDKAGNTSTKQLTVIYDLDRPH
jgi:cysteine-rich repeat protein